MPSTNTDIQRKGAFFHSLGKVLTEESNFVGNELYKSSHNVRSSEVWMSDIPFSPTYASASAASDGVVVNQVGTASNPVYLFPLTKSNYQTWFMDTGTPSLASDGFVPSEEWVKPLINPSDVPNGAGAPSSGFALKLYRPDGVEITYDFGYFEVDYFGGLVRFDVNRTPKDSTSNNGLNFQFSQSGFESVATTGNLTASIEYVKSTTTGGPRAVAWQYVGQTLADVDLSGGTSTITLQDYNTGLTVSNVDTIIIRGGSVTVPGGTATGGFVTGQSNIATVWIPAPDYADYFDPDVFSGTNRYVSNPDVNDYLISGTAGEFGIGDWTAGNTNRSVFNNSSEITAFSDSDFACFNAGTTMSFHLYDETDNLIQSIDNFVIDGVGSTESNGLTINITDFQLDSDRYKATVNGTIDVPSLFPNGGRMSWVVTHYNGEGAGNGTVGVYSFSVNDLFYDAPSNQSGSNSTAKINGTVSFDEDTPQLKYYSGVAFYDIDSTFGITVSDIDLLNEITYPNNKQIDIVDTNMAISSDHQGHSDGSTGKNAITGWTTDWNISGLTYSVTADVDETGLYIPGFVNNTTNVISDTPSSSFTSNLYDYGVSDTVQSVSKLLLFDTLSPTSVTYNNNPLNSEDNRLSTTDVMTDGSSLFDSSSALPNDELQYIFGRVIFPQTNFNQFLPSANTAVDYSSLTGVNKSFDVYTDTTSSPVTTSVSFNDYRWFVTSYGKDVSYSSSFANGIFTLNSNFLEEDLHYDTDTASSGTEDLVLLIGLDSSGANSTPDKFLFITGDPLTYKGRSSPTTYNLNETSESSKKIQFTFGNIPSSVKKVWLFIGYKNTNRGKNLRITNISLT